MSSTVEEHMALYECEAKLCRYISEVFDGKPKVFDKEIEGLYDDLFHEDFTLAFIDGSNPTARLQRYRTKDMLHLV